MLRREYIIESSKVNEDKNIAVCADMHIKNGTPRKKIEDTLEILEDIKPTHIVIPGDLYDNVDLGPFSGLGKVCDFISSATEIADVFYLKGDAEQTLDYLPYKFTFNTNPHFHLLCERNNNGKRKYFSNNGINIAGLKLPRMFYMLSENDRVDFLCDKYQAYLENLLKKCGPDNFNVLLCHDPIIKSALDYLAARLAFLSSGESYLNFDLIISGHNHGGIWPEWVAPVLKLMGANMESCYPTFTDGMLDVGDDGTKIVVSEGITRFHSDLGPLQVLENFHEGTIENIRVLSRSKHSKNE